MNQLELFCDFIASREGDPITPAIAKMARDLVGYADPETNPIIELFKGQLMILLLRDLGGDKTYQVDVLDNDTCGLLLKMEVKTTNKRAIRVYLEKKVGRG